MSTYFSRKIQIYAKTTKKSDSDRNVKAFAEKQNKIGFFGNKNKHKLIKNIVHIKQKLLNYKISMEFSFSICYNNNVIFAFVFFL